MTVLEEQPTENINSKTTEILKNSPEELLELAKGKKIGQIHYTLNGTDGVSLQAQETKHFLELVGADCFLFSSDVKEDDRGTKSSELDRYNPEIVKLNQRIFDPVVENMDLTIREKEENEILEEIQKYSEVIYNQLILFIDGNNLDVVHIRNLSALPFLHMPAAVAVKRAIKDRPNIKFILHHHDFYWEGPTSRTFISHYQKINDLANEVVAPDFENTKHICINTIAQKSLKKRKGIDATYIPDGFNFDKAVNKMTTEEEQRFKEKYGIGDNDLVFALTTRTRINKGYQTAVRIIKNIQEKRFLFENQINGVGKNKKKIGVESKIFLIVVQPTDFDKNYYDQVEKYAQAEGVNIVYVGEDIVSDTNFTEEDHVKGKIAFYSLTHSKIIDAVLYTATHEGFGNQAIEAAWAKVLLVMFGYPVAIEDIFDYVSGIIQVGSMESTEEWENHDLPIVKEDVIGEAVDELIKVLLDHDLEIDMTSKAYAAFRELCHMYKIGMQYLQLYF